MQVTTPTMQHAVMIEAVENHMPEVIVIDEIGTELEAQAARTIAERGVQLVGTAHGNTLENLAVDAILRGQPTATETRWLDETGEIRIEKEEPVTVARKTTKGERLTKENKLPKLYPFGINRGRLEQAAKEMQLSLDIVNSLNDANLFITSKNYYRRKPQKVRDAEAANLPIYVLKSNTPSQIRQLLATIYPKDKTNFIKLALSEAKEAVARVKNGQETVELSPQSAYIRRLQHLIAEQGNLSSNSLGEDPNRRVMIYGGR